MKPNWTVDFIVSTAVVPAKGETEQELDKDICLKESSLSDEHGSDDQDSNTRRWTSRCFISVPSTLLRYELLFHIYQQLVFV